ncbi:hypothetical protein JOB18_044296 [Solea senegalensis]|uniref:Uncharacterized protein n=1 Tax=Solea senegalensis TaxID=28829 RepID=A0AAV6Q5N7_SOLSE|nr:hypothetical protein JOB18_044296 [Solea senegalensis]
MRLRRLRRRRRRRRGLQRFHGFFRGESVTWEENLPPAFAADCPEPILSWFHTQTRQITALIHLLHIYIYSCSLPLWVWFVCAWSRFPSSEGVNSVQVTFRSRLLSCVPR